MRNYFTLCSQFICCLLLSGLVTIFNVSAQTMPVKQWDKRFGGSGEDYLFSSQQTSDGGLILGGYSASGIGGEKSQPMAGYDYWIVKTDASGNKLWDKTFSTNSWDYLVIVKQTTDGGYIIGGHTSAGVEGDKTESSRGSYDYWVVKTDVSGNKLWDKRFGGSGSDQLGDLQQTTDGGYILGGYSVSPADGDKSETSRGNSDYWVVKIDAIGNKLWDKRFGGNSDDELNSLQQTSDGGYILGGSSYSGIGGDKSQASRGDRDYWMVKTDATGNKLWDKRFGTVAYYGAYFLSIQQTNDGGYILGGFTTAGIVGDKSVAPRGSYDYWIVKTDATGNKLWDKGFGGSGSDALRSLQQTSDGGYLLGGNSDSGISGDKSEASNGGSDFWIVKTNASGDKLWDKTYGGSGTETGYTLQPAGNGAFFIGGYSTSGISGDRSESSRGGNDYWGVKFNFSTLSPIALSADQVTASSGSQVVVPVRVSDFTNILTAQGTVTFDPAVVTFANAEQFAFADMTSSSFGVTQAATGKITFSWDDADLTGENLANNAVLFALRFNVIGAPGTISPVQFTSVPTPLEFTNAALNTLTVNPTNGSITVPALSISTGSLGFLANVICPGSAINVPFTATGFSDPSQTFVAQLSDGSGSFASPLTIGTGTTSPIAATIPNSPMAGTGYRIRVVSTSPSVTGTDNGTDFQIAAPVVSATTNSSSGTPLCSGSTITLTGSNNGDDQGYGSVSYLWTGPNGFSSTQAHPTISNATVAMAGIYTYKVFFGSTCTSEASVSVYVNPLPATPVATYNSPLSAGSTLQLSATTISGATYSWTGPNSFTSTLQNPSISSVSSIHTGTYSVTAIINGCSSTVATVDVILNHTVSGLVRSEHNTPINTVTLTTSGGTAQSSTTNATGAYSFNFNGGGTYSIVAAKSNDVVANNGVTTLDIALVRRHILGVQALGSPYKILAADVNASDAVTTADIAQMRSLILTTTTSFSGQQWKFVPGNYVFATPANPFPYTSAVSTLSLTNLSSAQTVDFIGLKLGDVNNTWDNTIAKLQAAGDLYMLLPGKQVQPQDTVVIPVKVKDFTNVSGYQFTMEWDKQVLQYIGVVPAALQGAYGQHQVANGKLTTTWDEPSGQSLSLTDSTIIFQLKFKAIGPIGFSSPINITSALTRAESYNHQLAPLNLLSTTGQVQIGTVTGVTEGINQGYAFFQNYPNPFSTNTTFSFTLPKAEKVTLTIYNSLGQVIATRSAAYGAGEHQFDLKNLQEKNLSSGTYFVNFTAGNFLATRKMIVLK